MARKFKPVPDDSVAAENHAALRARARAEARLRDDALIAAPDIDDISPEATRQLLHDLRVHKIELEMQNDELRRTQIALDIERARYFDLYDLAPVGYCSVSAQGLIEHANLTAATLLGMTRATLIKRPVTRFISKTDQDVFYLCRKQLLTSGEAQTCELRMLRADATPFWACLAMSSAQPVDGAAAVRLTLTDIENSKQAQARLRESEERYRNLFDSMDEGYCIIEVLFDTARRPVDYRYLEVNRAFAKQSGMPEMTGKRVREVYPDLEQHWFDAFGQVALTGASVRFTDQAKSVEGRWFDVFAFRIGDNESRKVAIVFSNVSELMQADSERTRLDQIVREKNAELERAIAIADKANLAKSDFLSSMSHELRTPLSAILGFAQLIESGLPAPTPSQKRSIDQILKSGWYLLDLINEILDLALVESGKMSLSLEPIALHDVIAECRAMVEPEAQQHNVTLTMPSGVIAYFVIADWTRLKQVLINILSNAIKYNKPGGSVVIGCHGSGPGRVRVSVTDSGEGLSEEKLAQLFQPFNRLGRESGPEQGTGIGLVVSRRLIELMGGVIGVESRPGVGSVFWIELTLTGLRRQVPADLNAAAIVRARAADHSAPRTVLYVEDNPANLLLVEELIARRPDLRLISARDGQRGVDLACSELPDMILMDINLPGISGLVALNSLAANPATAHIPIVALSANAMPRDIERGLEAGFFRYLTKPIKVNEFMETLDIALKYATSQIERLHPGGTT